MKRFKKISNEYKLLAASLLAILLSSGCKKLIEIPAPVTSVNAENAYTQDVLAAGVINGIYANLSSNTVAISDNITGFCSVYPALMGDELSLNVTLSPGTEPWYRNNLNAGSHGGKPWAGIYAKLIYPANAAIEGLGASKSLTPSVRNQLLGEAYFLRALGYFYLTNLYGDVPMVVSTDYELNRQLGRSAQAKVYEQMVADLTQAKSLLAADYLGVDALTPAGSRITPNRAAAQALLARVYLYAGNYPMAEAEATGVIDQNGFYALGSLDNTFLATSTETIWQLQPVNTGQNVQEAIGLVIPATGPDLAHPYQISSQLLAAFEAGDQRKTKWIGVRTLGSTSYYYPNKYKISALNQPVKENKIMLRLAEVYLIRAEARAQNGTNFAGAKDDLNLIRNRAGLPGTAAANAIELLNAIAKERQVELFLEWGDRWFNIKRTGMVNSVMSVVAPAKGGSWSAGKQLYPIPLSDIQRNGNLTQNPGY